MLKKIIQIFIFCAYWLCFVPLLTIFLWNQKILNPTEAMEYFTHFTILLFVFIVVYVLIHYVFDSCYMKHEIRKRVRKITIKRQLERLERGEISLEEAQNFNTFTRPKSPKSKRKMSHPLSKSESLKSSGKRSAPGTPTGSLRSKGRQQSGSHSEPGTPQRQRRLLKETAPAAPMAPPSYQDTVECDSNSKLLPTSSPADA